ncbi:MAG TPA: S41 family peptidase [Granulicella sp.]|jgi:carboxyl-terminal processing protease|nr:S41 family peptidase [Granulicella sp.]
MAPRTRRAFLSVSLFLATCAGVGSLINAKVAAQSASDESTLRDSLRSFTGVYSIVEQNYAEPLDSDKTDKAIYDGAIPGMLHTLDPHSNFFDPKAFAQMREDQHGKYYGVGMSIQPQPDKNGGTKIVVLSPFEGTPSYKAGIRPGDTILFIDGKSTAGMDSAAVASLLKGPKGTHVSVTMAREGAAKNLVFDLVRDDITRPSVDLAFMIRPGVGYIHVTSFIETTSHEVGDAIANLDQNNELHGLVIDLRGNPGGLMIEAVNMCDKFLQKGQIVVSQHGRAFPDQVYRATHGEQGPKYPIVVLVNRNTASAAEIVSGALQDHDRALIAGETTFGKGLVQTVFQISENTGLALTTYHYYTPSGRLIQRNYDHVSLYDYYYVRDDAKKADKSNLEVKLTDSGRTVYGGGGITPDEKIEPTKLSDFQNSLYQHYAFFDFSKHYLASHTVSKDSVVDDAVMQQFKDFLKANQIDYTDADLNGVLDWVKASIKSELFTSQFGQLEGLKIRAAWDPQINKAITFLPEAQALADHTTSTPAKLASTAH